MNVAGPFHNTPRPALLRARVFARFSQQSRRELLSSPLSRMHAGAEISTLKSSRLSGPPGFAEIISAAGEMYIF